ncbi:MAG: M48 family metallopeptidase [Candidatus Woesearchaeota archaeon]
MQNRIQIYDLELNYDISYRPVKYPRLEFKTGSLLLILPKNYKNEKKLLENYKDWIYKKHHEILSAFEASKSKSLITDRSLEELKEMANQFIKDNVSNLNLKINKVCFKRLKSKWASCSSSRNLTINTILQYLPKQLIEYVLYHEIVHLLERKHNKEFWKIIGKKFKDYSKKEKELFVYWFLAQQKLNSL